jgi:prepilin-type N-terminal cleavage/methylation domain-containing protein
MNLKTTASRGFTLLELLVVIAIIAVLASILLPALCRVKQHTQMTQCLNNLHQIGIGLKQYADDNQDTFPPGDSQQFNPNAPFLNYGNALGGGDPMPTSQFYPPAYDRPLTRFVPNRESWHCPVDRGLQPMVTATSIYQFNGSSYRFNWDLQVNYQSLSVAEDPWYNLAGKKENWPPEPSRFIMMHEAATFPWDPESGDGTITFAQWHYSANPGRSYRANQLNADPDKFVAPVVFVDGHCKQCDFTKTFRANTQLPLEEGTDYRWYKPLR